jgi:branched-chain amino acid transport system substrate-binding protein
VLCAIRILWNDLKGLLMVWFAGIGRRAALLLKVAATLSFVGIGAPCMAAEPIKVGFSMPLTGGLASGGKAALLTIQIWAEGVNQKGGLLGRPVKLVYYDDQSSPAAVPGIYTKLIEIDAVDLLVSSYGTALQVPAIPLAMRNKRVMMGMVGVASNKQFNYTGFFQISPAGPEPSLEFSRGFFETAMAQTPKPTTLAIVGTDVELSKVAIDGAREWAKRLDLKIVYDKTYPPNVVDLSPVIQAVQATKPELVYVASFPTDTGNFIRAVHEVGFRPKMLGGGLTGLQYAALKTQLGDMLNGLVNYEFYAPEASMDFPSVKSFLAEYQKRAAAEGVDPLGFYIPPVVYAAMQILQKGVEDVGSLDQMAIAADIHSKEFETIVGKISFGPGGEWTKGRYLLTQYQNVKGNGLDQFRSSGVNVIVYPPEFKSGNFVYPFAPTVQ